MSNDNRWQEFPHLLDPAYKYKRTLEQAFSNGTGLHIPKDPLIKRVALKAVRAVKKVWFAFPEQRDRWTNTACMVAFVAFLVIASKVQP